VEQLTYWETREECQRRKALVLHTLRNYADDNGYLELRVSDVAQLCGLQPGATSRAIGRLECDGLVFRVKRAWGNQTWLRPECAGPPVEHPRVSDPWMTAMKEVTTRQLRERLALCR